MSASWPSSSARSWPPPRCTVRAARSSPTRARPARRCPSPTDRPAAAADPQPVVFPRDDGPHDRLTEWWYYTGHLAGAAATASSGGSASSTSSSGPSAATSRRLGLAPGHHRRDRRRLPLRPAPGGRAAGRPLAAGRHRGAGRLRPGRQRAGPDRPDDRSAARRGRWPAIRGRWSSRRGRPRPRPPRPGVERLGLQLRRQPGEAAGPPRRRRLDRLRAAGRLVLLLPDRDRRGRLGRRRTGRRSRSRASPGSTTSGATSSASAAAAGTGSRSTSRTAPT